MSDSLDELTPDLLTIELNSRIDRLDCFVSESIEAIGPLLETQSSRFSASKSIDLIAYNELYMYTCIYIYWSRLKLESCCLIGPIKILSDPVGCSSSGRPQNIGSGCFDLLDASIQPTNHHYQAPISLVLQSEPCPVSLQSPLPSI